MLSARPMIQKTTSPLAWHLVARAPSPQTPFSNRSRCVLVWNRMVRAFPQAAAAVLMPNHLHVLLWHDRTDPSLLLRMLRRCLCKTEWQPLPLPQSIPDIHQLKRQVRYIHLNPCRKGICNDPLQWEWSTHLDYLGLIAAPWPAPHGHLEKLGFYSKAQFHKYISADPTSAVTGTPLPREMTVPHYFDLEALASAAALLLRIDVESLWRRGPHRAGFGALLTGPFRIPVREVARALNLHPSSLSPRHRMITEEELRQARALVTILHDPRLRALAERLARKPDKMSGLDSKITVSEAQTRHFVGLDWNR